MTDDLISRQALYEKTAEWEAQALHMVEVHLHDEDLTEWRKWSAILNERTAFKHDVADAPSAEPQIMRCRECVYYDPPHIENGTRRYEYKDMPSDAFDELGTGLVHSGYGVNVGGRCLRSKTRLARGKSIFMDEDDYCSKGERRADDE